MLSLIVAFGENRVIGKDNAMPWHYPSDLKYFKSQTLGHKVVMGLNTYKSIIGYLGKPFSGRENIIISDITLNEEFDNVTVYDNLDVIVEKYKNSEEEIFIAGGMSIYEQMLKHCDKLYITHINKSFEGDAYFPEIDYSEFEKISSTVDGDLDFCVYMRKNHV